MTKIIGFLIDILYLPISIFHKGSLCCYIISSYWFFTHLSFVNSRLYSSYRTFVHFNIITADCFIIK